LSDILFHLHLGKFNTYSEKVAPFVMELVGTYFLVLVVCMQGVAKAEPLSFSIAVGGIVMVLNYDVK
jgi:hypothetical protein